MSKQDSATSIRDVAPDGRYDATLKQKAGAKLARIPVKVVQGEILKKPSWIRVKAPVSQGYKDTREILKSNRLVTVCEEAGCPNVGECWSQGHATMMIMGDHVGSTLRIFQQARLPLPPTRFAPET